MLRQRYAINLQTLKFAASEFKTLNSKWYGRI